MSNTYKYPRPAATADMLVFRYDDCKMQVLVVKRKNEPFKGEWALPGGYANENEPLQSCALRELREETGLKLETVFPLGTYSEEGRDPRGWTISQAFIGFVPENRGMEVKGGDDAQSASWKYVEELSLSFDHDVMLKDALEAMRQWIWHKPIIFDLLNVEFTKLNFLGILYFLEVPTCMQKELIEVLMERNIMKYSFPCLQIKLNIEELNRVKNSKAEYSTPWLYMMLEAYSRRVKR